MFSGIHTGAAQDSDIVPGEEAAIILWGAAPMVATALAFRFKDSWSICQFL